MNRVLVCIGWLLFGGAGALQAALLVKVGELKTTGGKTLIPLELKNTFDQKVESVRATVFLLDDQGKMAAPACATLSGPIARATTNSPQAVLWGAQVSTCVPAGMRFTTIAAGDSHSLAEKPLTGEPEAGDRPVRFGGRDGLRAYPAFANFLS